MKWATRNSIREGTKSAQLSTAPVPSRFSPVHAERTERPKFTILYGTTDLATACYEAIIRDHFDLYPARKLKPEENSKRCVVEISTLHRETLTLLDLTGGNAIRARVPTDVCRQSNHKAGQHFSEFVYRQMPYIDGFLYSSRFTNADCVGIYWRAVPKLTSGARPRILPRSMLGTVLKPWKIVVT